MELVLASFDSISEVNMVSYTFCRIVRCTDVRYIVVRYIVVRYIAVLYIVVWYIVELCILYGTLLYVHYCTVQCRTVHCDSVHCLTMHCCTSYYGALHCFQHIVVQYIVLRHIVVQYIVVLYIWYGRLLSYTAMMSTDPSSLRHRVAFCTTQLIVLLASHCWILIISTMVQYCVSGDGHLHYKSSLCTFQYVQLLYRGRQC